MELCHKLWNLEEYSAFDQVLKIGVDTRANPSIRSLPFTCWHVDVIANLVAQQNTSYRKKSLKKFKKLLK